MAAKKEQAAEASGRETVAVRVGDVDVAVDLTYVRSWAGLRQAARMASSQLSDVEKLVAMFEYYELAVPNVDEVSESMPDAPADEVLGLLSEAVRKATPKN